MLKISVIIVSYNGWRDTTGPCLERLFCQARESWLEVLVVDNGSSDGTPDQLTAWAQRESRLRVIANPSNLGYAAANNLGLRAALGDYFVLLNSDTQVPAGAMDALARHLAQHPDVGLAGPVTNACGNEQMIFTSGTSVGEILGEGEAWTRLCAGDWFETERLGFFCVAMRRDHWLRVGELDEQFGLGFFEDDDYCLRSRQAGFRLVCLEDVFVYHRGSFSFKQRPTPELKALLRKNKALLLQKHGRRHRPAHPRQRWLALAELCLDQGGHRPCATKASKVTNRLRLARGRLPKHPLKRLWFCLRCVKLERRLRRLQDAGV